MFCFWGLIAPFRNVRWYEPNSEWTEETDINISQA
ncbi:BnaC01g19210D [Brassica napus]|uniref:BnaC01g19210D protein n=1 Tax=Brassica napus TaxID=3708 RepID=A0A078GVT4_BRANA|nr:BnaC01g19210D [Brassica napus]